MIGTVIKTMDSTKYKEQVEIVKYDAANRPGVTCTRCGKTIRRSYYVVRSCVDGRELDYLCYGCMIKVN